MQETPGSPPEQAWLERLWAARLTFFNFFSLGLLKATDALILLFLIPIIISRVGIANFGVIAFVGVWLNFTASLLVLVQVIPFLEEKRAVFQWGLLMIAGQVFFTDWFFIGLQKSYLLALANLLIKSLYAVLIFWGINEEADFIYVLAYQGLAATLIGRFVITYSVFQF